MHIVEGKFHPNPAIAIEMENARQRTDRHDHLMTFKYTCVTREQSLACHVQYFLTISVSLHYVDGS